MYFEVKAWITLFKGQCWHVIQKKKKNLVKKNNRSLSKKSSSLLTLIVNIPAWIVIFCSSLFLALFSEYSLKHVYCIVDIHASVLTFSFIQHKCYIVGTCDRDLKRRIRKIPGVPIMFITKRR